MKLRVAVVVSLLIFLAGSVLGSEINHKYKRKIETVAEGWQKILLPIDLYQHAQSDLHDLRIVGVTVGKDTVEAPYLLEYMRETVEEVQVESGIINSARKGNDHYFTLEVPSNDVVNRIWLQFSQRNFDWLVSLEGSHDQQEWFELLDRYRIVSIKNALTDYSFSTLSFANSNYGYYRLLVKSDVRPTLESAIIRNIKLIEGAREDYQIAHMDVVQKDKNTILDIQLNAHYPISHLRIDVAADYDYYRRISIEYLADSFQTEKGWRYRYRPLRSGTVTSLEDNVFKFDKTLLKRMRVIINNQDNEPLLIERCRAWGFKHALIVRFIQEADYYLVYGDDAARKPGHDIAHFSDRIPEEMPELALLDEEAIAANEEGNQKDFVIPKFVLWGVLIFVVATLGYFAGKMLKSF